MRTQGAIQNIAGKVTATVIVFLSSQGIAATDGGGYESDQGTRVFGTMNPDLEGVSIPFTPSGDPKAEYESLSIKDGNLVMTRKDKTETQDVRGITVIGTPVGTKAKTGTTVTLKITDEGYHKNIYDCTTGTVIEYHVSVQDGSPDWKPLCDDSTNSALVVPAAWNRGQLSMSTQDTGFTFACVPILGEKTGSGFKPSSCVSAAHRTSAAILAPPKPLQVVQQPLPSTPGHAEPAPRSTPQGGMINSPALAPNSSRDVLALALVDHPKWHGGVAAKCIDRHYAPWAAGTSKPGTFTITKKPMPPWDDAAARGIHSICVQAMTADYAGDGTPHTIDGTTIALFDLTNLPVKDCYLLDKKCVPFTPAPKAEIPRQPLPGPQQLAAVQPRVGPTALGPKASAELAPGWRTLREVLELKYNDLTFEGVWTQDNAGNARAICLTKARWQSIDPSVPKQLLGPLLVGDKKVDVCESLTPDELDALARDSKLLLVSYSAINERNLYWFPYGAGGITTTRVQFIQDSVRPDGLPCKEPCDGVYLGNVLSPDAPTGGFDSPVGLYMYKKDKGGYVTKSWRRPAETSLSPVSSYNQESPPQSFNGYNLVDGKDAKPEGFLFKGTSAADSSAKTQELWLWQIRNGNDVIYCTTVESDKNLSAVSGPNRNAECNGYTKVSPPLGYLLVPNRDIAVLASTTRLFVVRPPIVSGPGPVERPETNGTRQQQPTTTPAPTTTRPVIPVQAPAAQATKAMQQIPAAQAAKATERTPAAHAPAATVQTPQ